MKDKTLLAIKQAFLLANQQIRASGGEALGRADFDDSDVWFKVDGTRIEVKIDDETSVYDLVLRES